MTLSAKRGQIIWIAASFAWLLKPAVPSVLFMFMCVSLLVSKELKSPRRGSVDLRHGQRVSAANEKHFVSHRSRCLKGNESLEPGIDLLFIRISRGGLQTRVGDEAGKHDVSNASLAELVVQIGIRKGTISAAMSVSEFN